MSALKSLLNSKIISGLLGTRSGLHGKPTHAVSLVKPEGSIDTVEPQGHEIFVRGWVLGGSLGDLKSIRVHLGGSPLSIEFLSTNLDSVDVARAVGSIPGSERCRFELRAKLPQHHNGAATDRLLAIVPEFSGGLGRTFFSCPELSIPLPPEKLIAGIGCGFLPVAFEFLHYFVDLVGIKPDERVLDVGCGCGRLAIPLAIYLDPQHGSYQGFDIVDDAISWAQNNIQSRFPHTSFSKVEVYNRWYNPKGSIVPDKFVFPLKDESIDFVFLTSVFTHMLEAELKNYLRQIARVLKPKGRVLMTAFLLNERSQERQAKGLSAVTFPYQLGRAQIADRHNPEGAVAYEEAIFLRWLEEAGLTARPIYYGSWSGRPSGCAYDEEPFTDYQDIIIAHRA